MGGLCSGSAGAASSAQLEEIVPTSHAAAPAQRAPAPPAPPAPTQQQKQVVQQQVQEQVQEPVRQVAVVVNKAAGGGSGSGSDSSSTGSGSSGTGSESESDGSGGSSSSESELEGDGAAPGAALMLKAKPKHRSRKKRRRRRRKKKKKREANRSKNLPVGAAPAGDANNVWHTAGHKAHHQHHQQQQQQSQQHHKPAAPGHNAWNTGPPAIPAATASHAAATATAAVAGAGAGGGAGAAEAPAPAPAAATTTPMVLTKGPHNKNHKPQVFFFPDKAMPCRYGSRCHRSGCKYAHGPTNLTSVLLFMDADNCKKTLDICVFSITCNEIANAVEAAYNRGVNVRLITDDDQSESVGSDAKWLASKGVPVRTDFSSAHMHHKFAVIDGGTTLTGSFNWTRGAVLSNEENVLVTDSKAVARTYSQEFERLWKEFDPAKRHDGSNALGGGTIVATGDPEEPGRGSEPLNVLMFFPDPGMPCRRGPNCRKRYCKQAHSITNLVHIIRFMALAKHSMDICVFTITLDEIRHAIVDAVRRGVKVRIITDDEKADDRGSDIKWLASKGVQARTDNSPYHMHNKFCVIDGFLTLTGSFNWTHSAVVANKENVLVTDVKPIAELYSSEFERLWALFADNEV